MLQVENDTGSKSLNRPNRDCERKLKSNGDFFFLVTKDRAYILLLTVQGY
jgi:hypothetical protein